MEIVDKHSSLSFDYLHSADMVRFENSPNNRPNNWTVTTAISKTMFIGILLAKRSWCWAKNREGRRRDWIITKCCVTDISEKNMQIRRKSPNSNSCSCVQFLVSYNIFFRFHWSNPFTLWLWLSWIQVRCHFWEKSISIFDVSAILPSR